MLKNIAALIIGILVGGLVNMGIVMLSPYIVALPEGIDVTDPESIKAKIHLFKTHHFILPFLAHAVGTLVGAFVAAKMASSHKMKFGLAVGAFFLIGGIMNSFMIPAPLYFMIADLALAYIPMGWLGGKLATK